METHFQPYYLVQQASQSNSSTGHTMLQCKLEFEWEMFVDAMMYHHVLFGPTPTAELQNCVF